MNETTPRTGLGLKYPRVMFFDLERTGFFGPVVACGVSIQEASHDTMRGWIAREVYHWTLRCHVAKSDETDWYRDVLVPALEDVPASVSQFDIEMRLATEYDVLRRLGYVMGAHVPFPVETGLLHNRYEETGAPEHPFPFIDLFPMLLLWGAPDPTSLESWYQSQFAQRTPLPAWYREHHPLADARMAALAYWTLLGVAPAELEVPS